VLIVAMGAAAHAADDPTGVVSLPCSGTAQQSSACNPTKSDLKKAKVAFSKALKLEKEKRTDEAYKEFDTAARLVPRNVDYVTALAITREELVSQHLMKGTMDLNKNLPVEAAAEFGNALNLDPDNTFAQQRLQETETEWLPRSKAARVLEDSGELQSHPNDSRHAFHFRGDSKALLSQVGEAYGLSATVDESVVSRRVHFDLDETDFYTAMRAAGEVTGTFWTPLAEKQILVAKESPENHRMFDRMMLRSFEVPTVDSPQDLNDLVNLMRNIFEVKFVQPQAHTGVLTVRAPAKTLDAITRFLSQMGKARPQVVLDIEVYEIDHQLTRNMGLHIPDNFNLFNIPAAALAGLTGLGGQNIQSLINQLISSGGINQANSSAVSGLLAQLQGQQNSIFSQPLATFGGGLTFMGLSLDQIAAQLSLNESWVRLLDHATLRASQGLDSSFRLGQRYPIINASFAPIFNTSAISQVLQNGSFQAPIPSFSYEDLGLDLKAKPGIFGPTSLSLDLEMQLRTLAGQSLNGVPVIANRQYKGSINLEDGEPAVVASALTLNEQLSMTGIPGFGLIPGLNKIMTTNTKMDEENELLLVITPHVVNLEPSTSSMVLLQ